MCRFVQSPTASSIRLVRFLNAPMAPLQETASTGPIPSFVTTTSTFFVLRPPYTVRSPAPPRLGSWTSAERPPFRSTRKSGRGTMSSGSNPPSTTRRQATYQ